MKSTVHYYSTQTFITWLRKMEEERGQRRFTQSGYSFGHYYQKMKLDRDGDNLIRGASVEKSLADLL